MSNKNLRLQFTKEEQAAPELKKPVRKAAKAADKADAAQAKIPTKKKVEIQRTFDESTKKSKVRLQFEDAPKPAPSTNLSHAVKAAPVRALKSQVHKEIQQSEGDNVGVESAHKLEEVAETGGRVVQNAQRSHKLKPYRKSAKAEARLEKANVNALHKKSLQDNPQLSSNPLSRWQQKRTIRKEYAAARKAGDSTVQGVTAVKRGTEAVTAKATGFIKRHKKGIAVVLIIAMMVTLLLSAFSSCGILVSGGISAVATSTYPSEETDMLAVEAAYIAKEQALQSRLNNYEAQNPGYDEYVFELDIIGHDPHELAAYLSAAYQSYTLSEVTAELQRVFDLQYALTETVTEETRYRDETITDPETGETSTESVAYTYYIMTVTLTNNWLSGIITASLNAEQLNFFGVYRATQGNMPLLFGGGSNDYSHSVDISGVVFINGERPGNQDIVDIALSQIGNAGGYPYWSWYGWQSRVAWCACFVSWCINQAGSSEPFFAYCPFGATWFSQQGQWARRGYEDIAPGDVIFFDWEPDGITDHVGIVIGTDGTYVYTVEGNTGDSVKVKAYLLDSSVIYGYGLMNW